jgi:hypothetical protein
MKMNIVSILAIFLLSEEILLSQTLYWENLGLKNTLIFDIEIDKDGSIYVASQPVAILKSTDNGLHWENKTQGITTNNGTSIEIDSKGNIYLTSLGGVFKSTDKGDNWFRIAQEIENLEFHKIKVIPNDYLFLSNFNGIYRSTDYGENWETTNYTYWGVSEIGINNNGVMFAGNISASWFSIYRSSNFGKDWIYSSRLPANAFIFSGNGDVFAGVINNPIFDSEIYKSDDNGITWNNTNSFGSSDQIYIDMASDIYNNFYTIVSGERNGVYFSSDSAKSWHYYGLAEYSGSISCLAPDSLGYIYVGTFRDGLFRIIEPITPVELISFTGNIYNNNILLKWVTATESNNLGFDIERKRRNGNWEKIGFIQGQGTSLSRNEYSYKDEYISSDEYLYRLKQIDFDGTFNYSIEISVVIPIKTGLRLDQNYPNPFNPSTLIGFTIPYDANVIITIYNVLGEKIQTLLNSNLSKGSHSIKFTLENSILAESSGIYFYRLQCNNSFETKKMIFLK